MRNPARSAPATIRDLDGELAKKLSDVILTESGGEFQFHLPTPVPQDSTYDFFNFARSNESQKHTTGNLCYRKPSTAKVQLVNLKIIFLAIAIEQA